MNEGELRRRIWQERKHWERILGQEASWVIRGIDLCRKHINDLIRERRVSARMRAHTYVAANKATLLFHACKSALRYLKLSDRSGAMKILGKTIDKIEVGK